jgi:anaerobic selenocysteine-containing dehydrogenase
VIAEIGEDQKIKRVLADPSNPVTRNYICPRGKMDHKRIYTNRVLHPHIRVGKKPKRDFKQISWNTVLLKIVNRLQMVLDNHSAEKVLFLDYAGNIGLATEFLPQRLWNAIGATLSDYGLCSKSGHDALNLHYGLSYGMQPEELLRMNAIVFWGFNVVHSSPHMWRLAQKAQSHIITIDPRKTELAKKSDLWIQPKPGSDVGLAYGVMNYLITHNYVDSDFIQKWTSGYVLLKEAALKWTPKKVETFTGINWKQIKALSELYWTLNPNVTMIGIGIQKNHAGAEMVRAIGLIPALLGIHRGFYYTNDLANFVNYEYLTGKSLTSTPGNIVSQVAVGELIEKGDFKFIFINCMNPAVTLPNQSVVRAGLSREDVFVITHETHWTSTTDYSDIVLPAPTHLEKDDLVIPWSHNYIRKSLKVVDPLAESMDEYWLMQQLSRLLKLKDTWLYEKKWDAIEKSMNQAIPNRSFSDLHRMKTLQLIVRPKNDYQTNSKKIEFYSRAANALGLNPLPMHLPCDVKSDEFLLLNSSIPKYTNTQFQEIYGPIPSLVEINPDDAKRLNIKNEGLAFIYNRFGNVRVRLKFSDHVPTGVLWSPRQFETVDHKPMNLLTTSEPQKLGKGPKFNSTVVRIRCDS